MKVKKPVVRKVKLDHDVLVNPPTYEELLVEVREAYRLLKKTGPGKRNRATRVEEILRNLNNYEVEVTSTLPGTGTVETVKVHNMDRGGCCDPTTETYWSM